MTSLSVITTSTKAKSVLEVSETQDTFYNNIIEKKPLVITGQWAFGIGFGDFYLDGDYAKGHADVIFILDGSLIFIPVPIILFDEEINFSIKDTDPNALLITRFHDHVIIQFMIVL